MKSLKEALVHKHLDKPNPFRITKKDMIGSLKGFPVGVVVRMLEEQSLQGNKSDVKVFQENRCRGADAGGFDWPRTECGRFFWEGVVDNHDYGSFFTRYPEYKKYNI